MRPALLSFLISLTILILLITLTYYLPVYLNLTIEETKTVRSALFTHLILPLLVKVWNLYGDL